jgi:hypothetical protein
MVGEEADGDSAGGISGSVDDSEAEEFEGDGGGVLSIVRGGTGVVGVLVGFGVAKIGSKSSINKRVRRSYFFLFTR